VAATTEVKDTPVNIKLGQQGKPFSTPAANSTANANATATKISQGVINLELVGEYNGQPITDVNLDNVEDTPWGKLVLILQIISIINEVSWRSYCAKKKMLRENKKINEKI
jgi:pre-mRNA 3'-end-processing factor FIP1